MLAELKANPGRWALWPSKTNPAQLRKAHGVEAVTRRVDGVHKVYVRWPATVAGSAASVAGSEKVLRCETCRFEVDTDEVKKLAAHVRGTHARSLSALERTPVKPS